MKALAPLLLMVLAACTPGGIAPPAGGQAVGAVTTIDVNLTLHPDGYAPDTVNVPVGSSIRFFNSDGFAHTATLIAGATTFPNGSPFDASAQTRAGSAIAAPWSSGTLPSQSASQIIVADTPGTYFFGCFFHYGAPMRGKIVVR